MKPDGGYRRWILLILLACLAAYASAWHNGFVWDDDTVIQKGRYIGSLRNVPALFAHNTMWNSDGGQGPRVAVVDTYRPLTMTTFAIERAMFGLAPRGYHLGSILIHACNAILVLFLGLRLGLGPTASGGGALLFAVHPSISEAVHWINGRSDPLAVLFFLAGVLLWWPLLEAEVPPRRRWVRAAGVAALALAGSLCKETIFMLAGGLAVVVAHRRLPIRRALLVMAPWAVGLGLGLCMRLLALGRPAAGGGSHHLAHAAARVPIIWRDALGSLLSPSARLEPSLYQRYAQLSFPDLALAALVVGAALWAAIEAWRRRILIVPWALAGVLLSLAPIALLTHSEGWSGWGRYLYPAAPLFCLLASWLVLLQLSPRARPTLRRTITGLAVLALLVCAAQTFIAGRVWRDDESLARAWIEEGPDSAVGYEQLGLVHFERGQPDQALPLVQRAVALAPQIAEGWAKLAMVEAALGRRQDAWQHSRRAVQLDPRNRLGRYTVVWSLLNQGGQAEAAQMLLPLLAEEPAADDLWQLLRQAWMRTGPGSPFRQTIASAGARRTLPVRRPAACPARTVSAGTVSGSGLIPSTAAL